MVALSTITFSVDKKELMAPGTKPVASTPKMVHLVGDPSKSEEQFLIELAGPPNSKARTALK